MSQEPTYEVVWPLGQSIGGTITPTAAVPDLNGKTVCELWDWLFRGEEIFPLVREALRAQYPDVRFVDYTAFGNTHGKDENELMARLPRLLAEHECDAVISGVGA